MSLIILLSFVYTASICQQKNSTHYFSPIDPCNASFILDSTGFYFTAAACDRSANVGFGRYTLSADKIFFKPLSFDSLPPIASIYGSAATNDTAVKVTIVARYSKAIPDIGFAVDAIDTSGKHYKRFLLNGNRAFTINRLRYKTLRINYLDHFYAKWVYVEIRPSDFTVELSLPQSFFMQHHPQFDMQQAYSLTLKPDGLYNTANRRVAIAAD